MDYKTNILTSELQTEEMLLPEFPDLHFGIIGKNKAVFDYTAYTEVNNIEVDYKTFMRMRKNYIETLAKASNKKTSELFYQNTNGHILVDAILVFVFLSAVNPDALLYFNDLLTDVISDGVAYSRGYIYNLAAEKMPSEILTEIVMERKEEN